ncbi:MAG: site-2 protease family protein [Lentisphaeria bacterium]
MNQIIFSINIFSFRIHISIAFLLFLGIFCFGTSSPLIVALALSTSVIAHEIGHALVLRRLRIPSEIILVFFGGETIWNQPPWKVPHSWQLLLALAGITINIIIAAIATIAMRFIGGEAWPMLTVFIQYLFFINVLLAVLNLVPIPPLDGGNALFHFFSLFIHNKIIALRLTMACAIAAGIIVIAAALFLKLYIFALFSLFFTYQNIKTFKSSLTK